jgi:hypothetical protein
MGRAPAPTPARMRKRAPMSRIGNWRRNEASQSAGSVRATREPRTRGSPVPQGGLRELGSHLVREVQIQAHGVRAGPPDLHRDLPPQVSQILRQGVRVGGAHRQSDEIHRMVVRADHSSSNPTKISLGKFLGRHSGSWRVPSRSNSSNLVMGRVTNRIKVPTAPRAATGTRHHNRARDPPGRMSPCR